MTLYDRLVYDAFEQDFAFEDFLVHIHKKFFGKISTKSPEQMNWFLTYINDVEDYEFTKDDLRRICVAAGLPQNTLVKGRK